MKNMKKMNTSSLASRAAKSAGEVRILSGKWRRTPLAVMNLDGLRPTGSRVRETVFDWLRFLLPEFEGRKALDMFAGSGALGFEFASRGGASVLIEKDRRNAQNLKASQSKLHAENEVRVIQGDCFSVLERLRAENFDVIFIDPPFAAELQQKALSEAEKVLHPDGLIYIEMPLDGTVAVPERFTVLREGKAGAVAYRILTRNTSARASLRKEK